MEISEDEWNKLNLDKLSLEKENSELKGKLTSLKALDEELTAKRVFDLAYKRMTSYLTFGGVFTIILGFVGYKTVTDFVRDQAVAVAKKMDSTAVTKIAVDRLDIQIGRISKRELSHINQNLNDSAAALFKNISNKVITLSQPQSLSNEGSRSKTKSIPSVAVPSFFDLSGVTGQVRDQGTEGSVVGFALADLLTSTYNLQQSNLLLFSPRYIYNSINHHIDGGALITDGLNLLRDKGAILEKDWPYVPGQFSDQPPANVNSVPHYRIDSYSKIDISVNKFKELLFSKKIILIGMLVFQEYYGTKSDGILAGYNSNFKLSGGHSVVIVGYDDLKRLLKLRFNWGTNFGNNGYVYLHYSDLQKVVTQAYVIDKILPPR